MRRRATTPDATQPGGRGGSAVPPPLGDTRNGRRDYGTGGGTFPSSGDGWTSRRGYYPDQRTIQTRPWRSYETFSPYWSRPRIGFGDPYNALFWWWLLDRSLDERALWAYHHRDTMDPARYQALVSTNKELQQRIEQLEAQQVKRDTNYTPANLDRDLMYSDRHVSQAHSNRPTRGGFIAFWLLAIPTIIGVGFFLVWLVFLKRWHVSTA